MIPRRLARDLVAVLGFFTRLPVGGLLPAGADAAGTELAGAVWAFPLAGALVGLLAGGAYALAVWARLPPLLGAGWAWACALLLTGALHEDGLADTADGFGGGSDAARKLQIMRDSRIGSYGALALLASAALRIAAVAALRTPGRVCAGLIVAGALSRAAIVLLLALLAPARRDGMAARLHPLPRVPALAAWGVALVLDGALLRGSAILVAPAGAVLATLLLAALSRRQIGGHTGDVLGAAAVLAECVVLSVLVSTAPPG